MKKFIFVFIGIFLIAATVSAQPVTMTTGQKVQLTAAAIDAVGAAVVIPQTSVTLQWSSNCQTCTISNVGYDVPTKSWSMWFNSGVDLGVFTVTLNVTYNTTGQKFSATQSVTINEVIVIPASVKVVPGVPILK